MPKGSVKIYPLQMSVCLFGAREQLVYTRKGLVRQRNKVVCEHDNTLVIQVALTCAQLELLSNCFHRSIFPQCRPVVKPIFSNFKSIFRIRLYFAQRPCSALLNKQWVQDAYKDSFAVKQRCYWFVVSAGCFHYNACIRLHAKNIQRKT